jgi:hypothetical protein
MFAMGTLMEHPIQLLRSRALVLPHRRSQRNSIAHGLVSSATNSLTHTKARQLPAFIVHGNIGRPLEERMSQLGIAQEAPLVSTYPTASSEELL